ncbi:MAG: molybdate ABC transporter substrate-binding protein [Clostridiales bacterium]|nr:molybdate ABC transporter substrate-binding protein [Clostridiales bacterium]
MKKALALVMALALCALALCACGAPERESQTWELYVAAGMKKPMDVVAQRYMDETGDTININYSSSGALFSQIEQGQPCDLYFTADWLYVEKMEEIDLCEEKAGYLNDNVVLVVSESAKDKIKSFEDLTKEGVTIAICDVGAPVGLYAENGLRAMGLWDAAEKNVVTRPSTVNQAAIMVLQDEVDAACIFSSVANSNGLENVDVMTNEESGEIVFATVVVKGGNTKVAKEFVEFANKDENLKEFEKYGWVRYEK